MISFIKSLQFIYKPRYWVMNHPYCPILDKKINVLLDQGVKFTNITGYAADLGDLKEIWLWGYPYAFGKIWNKYHYRPSRLTIKRMRQVLLQQIKGY